MKEILGAGVDMDISASSVEKCPQKGKKGDRTIFRDVVGEPG